MKKMVFLILILLYLIILNGCFFDNPDNPKDLNFPRGSTPVIDGTLADQTQWEEYGYWFQDRQNDEQNLFDDNMDIDKVYVKQDDENVYFLITFFDSGPPTVDTSVNINIRKDDNTFEHLFYASYISQVWAAVQVEYPVGTADNTNCFAFSSNGFIELQFDKTLPWSSIPSTPFRFELEVQDSGQSLSDKVTFYGSYKADGDPTPTP